MDAHRVHSHARRHLATGNAAHQRGLPQISSRPGFRTGVAQGHHQVRRKDVFESYGAGWLFLHGGLSRPRSDQGRPGGSSRSGSDRAQFSPQNRDSWKSRSATSTCSRSQCVAGCC
jgi:hypothetical protein